MTNARRASPETRILQSKNEPKSRPVRNVALDLGLDWTGAQYDAFAERRRADAEAAASERYVDDLAAAAKLLESGSTSPASTIRKPRGKKNVGS